MNRNDLPDEVYPASDVAPIGVAAESLRTTIATLSRLEEFFRHHASPAVHAELRAFCAAQGWHRVCGAEALLDALGLGAFTLRHGLDSAANTTPAQPTRPQQR
jgi:hypothetical protein